MSAANTSRAFKDGHWLDGNWGGGHFPFVRGISNGPERKNFNLGRRIVARCSIAHNTKHFWYLCYPAAILCHLVFNMKFLVSISPISCVYCVPSLAPPTKHGWFKGLRKDEAHLFCF
jgi:hypothetical protein